MFEKEEEDGDEVEPMTEELFHPFISPNFFLPKLSKEVEKFAPRYLYESCSSPMSKSTVSI